MALSVVWMSITMFLIPRGTLLSIIDNNNNNNHNNDDDNNNNR